MAQTKRKRRTKHRGNAAGMVEARGRTSSGASAGGAKKGGALRTDRLDREPTWRSAASRSAIATLLFVVVIGVVKRNIALPIAFALPLFVLYTGFGYYTDKWIWQRRMAKRKSGGGPKKAKA